MNVSDLIGKTFDSVANIDNERVRFHSEAGQSYAMYHSQDCCEHVYLEDVCGDLADLENTPILSASEDSSHDANPVGVSPPNDYTDDSFTWTFYNFRTIKGSVTLRWYGSSNGYYSESVDIYEVS